MDTWTVSASGRFTMLKHCTKCGELLPITDFYRDRSTRDGLTCWCKWCKREYAISPAGRRALAKSNASISHRRSVERYSRSEASRERYRRYARSEWGKKRRQQYRRSPGGRAAARAGDLNRKARKHRARDAADPVGGETITNIRTSRHCLYCGVETDKVTIDHILPLARGGKHVPENLAAACMYCNQSKSVHGVWSWLMSHYPGRIRNLAKQGTFGELAE